MAFQVKAYSGKGDYVEGPGGHLPGLLEGLEVAGDAARELRGQTMKSHLCGIKSHCIL